MDWYPSPSLRDAETQPHAVPSDDIRRKLRRYLQRFLAGPPAPSLVLIGRPGIGTIVLSDQMVRIEPAREPLLARRTNLRQIAGAARQTVKHLKPISSFKAARKNILIGPNCSSGGTIIDKNDVRSLPNEPRLPQAKAAALHEDPNLAALTASFRLRNWLIAS